MTKSQARQRIAKLRREIDHHRYLYHVKDTQEISEAALDSLKHELQELEQKFPDLITPTSPTQRVGGQPLPEFKQSRHGTRMLSLQDAFSTEELQQWEARNQKILPRDFEYFVEPKIDGVAVALIYQDGVLAVGATRGDGQVGEDVTANLKTIEAIPLTLCRPSFTHRVCKRGKVEVRGEVYMLKKDFVKMNEQRKKAGKPLFANPRNVSAGSIRQLDPKLAASRPLRFIAWEITSGVDVKTRVEEYTKLQQLGFPVPPGAELIPNWDEFGKMAGQWEKNRSGQPFQIDGLVLKINDLVSASRLGIVGKAPRASIAYKFAAEEATTVVEDIVVQVGRTGALTPVARLKPVPVAGTTVSRATLHNIDEIKRKDVRVGDTVIVRKAGDIIPEVVKSLPKLRPKQSKPFKMPRLNPEKATFSQQLRGIIHAVGRSGFDIEGMGEKIIEQLLQAGLVGTPPDLWELEVGDLLPLERFAEKSAENLVKAIQSRKEVPLSRFIVALGIPNVGVVTAQDLAREFGTLDKLAKANQETLAGIEGVGDVVAQGIVEFFQFKETGKLLAKYNQVGIKALAEKSGGPLKNKTFVFTGSLGEDLTRDEAKQLVIQNGGKVASTVGEKVTYLVVGSDPGSKAGKAAKLGVKILSPGQFRAMINT